MPTTPAGYWTEGKVVNGTNMGGGVFMPGTPPPSPISPPSGGGTVPLEPPKNEVSVVSSESGKNALDKEINDHNNFVSQVSPPPTAQTTTTTKTTPSDANGSYSADELKAAGANFSDYTYNPDTKLFAPSATKTDTSSLDKNFNNDRNTINSAFSSQLSNMDAATQALIQSIKGVFNDRINMQMEVNRREVQGFNTLNIRNGTDRYAPGVAQSIITADENEGLKRIATIENEMMNKVSEAQQNLTDKKYQVFLQNRQEIKDLTTEYKTTLKDIHDKATAAAKDARDFMYKAKQDSVDNKLKSDQFTYQQKKDSIDQALRAGELNETKAKDARQYLMDQANMQIKAFEDGLTYDPETGTLSSTPSPTAGLTYDKTTGQLVKPDGTLSDKDITELPGIQEPLPGVHYFDPTQFSDAKQRQKAENVARSMGVPIISEKDVPNVQGLQTALQRLDDAQAAFKKIASSNIPGARLAEAPLHMVGGLADKAGIYQTDFQNALSDYKTARNAVISIASQLSGGGRSMGIVMSKLDGILPSTGLFGEAPETMKSAESNFQAARKLIYSGMKTYLPDAPLPGSGDRVYNSVFDYSTDHPTVTLSDGKTMNTAEAAAQLASEHPEWTDADIVKVLNQ